MEPSTIEVTIASVYGPIKYKFTSIINFNLYNFKSFYRNSILKFRLFMYNLLEIFLILIQKIFINL